MESTAILQESSITIDDAITLLGGFGHFQWLLDAALCFMSPPRVFQVLLMMFTTLDAPWRCVSNSSICLLNDTMSSSNRYRCEIPRTEWEYTYPKDYSITTEFDLHCENNWKKYLLSSIIFVGWGLGGAVLSWVADNYGRKIVIYPSQAMIIVVGLICSYLHNLPALIFCRFLIGFFIPGGTVQSFILISEYVGPQQRPLASLLLFVSFATSLCILALKAYLIRTWRLLSIVCTAPYVVTLFTYKFVPESIRWLRLKQKDKEVMGILARIAYWNKKEIPNDIRIKAPSEESVRQLFSPAELFKTRKIAFLSLNQGYTWFVAGMVYYGITLAAGDLGGSIYLNFALLSVVGIPSNFASIFFCDHIGRKKSVLISLLVSSICCFAVAFIPAYDTGKIFRIIIGISGKFFIGICFSSIYVWAVEVYPTTIRAMGMGFLQVTSRIGAASAPWVAKGLLNVHKTAPFIVMSIAALIAIFLAVFIPETRGKPTSETEEDMDNEAIIETRNV